MPALVEEMLLLHDAKNAGYSGADNPDPWGNFRECEDFGITAYDGVLVRKSDKWSRIKSLRRNPNNERVGEQLRDTHIDDAAYGLIAVAILDELTTQPDIVPGQTAAFDDPAYD